MLLEDQTWFILKGGVILVSMVDDSWLAEHCKVEKDNRKGSLNLAYFSQEWRDWRAICRGDKPASKLPPDLSCKGNV
jgi:hypothetical protein